MRGFRRLQPYWATAFVNKELDDALEEIPKSDNQRKDRFPVHSFVASCLKVGITLTDLRDRTFVSIMKVLFSYIDVKNQKQKSEVREATQADIDAFMR